MTTRGGDGQNWAAISGRRLLTSSGWGDTYRTSIATEEEEERERESASASVLADRLWQSNTLSSAPPHNMFLKVSMFQSEK